jgi:hypothetical protein
VPHLRSRGGMVEPTCMVRGTLSIDIAGLRTASLLRSAPPGAMQVALLWPRRRVSLDAARLHVLPAACENGPGPCHCQPAAVPRQRN